MALRAPLGKSNLPRTSWEMLSSVPLLSFFVGCYNGAVSKIDKGRCHIRRCVQWCPGNRKLYVNCVHYGICCSRADGGKLAGVGEKSYWAVMKSSFLLRMGLDMVARVSENSMGNRSVGRRNVRMLVSTIVPQ